MGPSRAKNCGPKQRTRLRQNKELSILVGETSRACRCCRDWASGDCRALGHSGSTSAASGCHVPPPMVQDSPEQAAAALRAPEVPRRWVPRFASRDWTRRLVARRRPGNVRSLEYDVRADGCLVRRRNGASSKWPPRAPTSSATKVDVMGRSVRMPCKCIARWSASGLRMTTAQARVPSTSLRTAANSGLSGWERTCPISATRTLHWVQISRDSHAHPPWFWTADCCSRWSCNPRGPTTHMGRQQPVVTRSATVRRAVSRVASQLGWSFSCYVSALRNRHAEPGSMSRRRNVGRRPAPKS